MSDPGALEEWATRNGFYKEFFGKSVEKSPYYNRPKKHVKETPKGWGGEVDYQIDNEGNLRKVTVSYNTNDREKCVVVSMVVNNYGEGEDHIRLEIRQKYQKKLDKLKHYFQNNLLACSVTPIHIPAYERGCLWTHILDRNITYPKDTNYHAFVNAALDDIKSKAPEIVEKKNYYADYEANSYREREKRNEQRLLENDAKQQEKLMHKNNTTNYFSILHNLNKNSR